MPEPTHTSFAGLIVIPPGGSLASNGFEFQAIDPIIVDRLLHLGAVTHKHDGAAALGDPAGLPTTATKSTGGAIAGGETIKIGYTLVDDDGGETLISPTKTVVTAGKGTDPGHAPTLSYKTLAGSLLAGDYVYGVTVTDGAGGESILSPLAAVSVLPGTEHAEVEVKGLKEILEETGGTEWRLWRQQGGGQWALIAKGTSATKMDDGTLVEDCTVEPPSESTTNGTAVVEIKVPEIKAEGATARARFVRVYATTDTEFDTSSLLDEYPIEESGETKTYTTLALSAGGPPPVTRCYAHAHKINLATEAEGEGGGGGGAVLKFETEEGMETYAEGHELAEGQLAVVENPWYQLFVWTEIGGNHWELIASPPFMPVGYGLDGPITTGVKTGIWLPKEWNHPNLIRVKADIVKGKVKVNVRYFGGNLAAPFKEIEVKSGSEKTVEPEEPLAIGSRGGKLDINVVEAAEEPEGLSFSLHLIGLP